MTTTKPISWAILRSPDHVRLALMLDASFYTHDPETLSAVEMLRAEVTVQYFTWRIENGRHVRAAVVTKNEEEA